MIRFVCDSEHFIDSIAITTGQFESTSQLVCRLLKSAEAVTLGVLMPPVCRLLRRYAVALGVAQQTIANKMRN